MERNLLNDSIPPEKSQKEGFYLCLSHSGFPSDICRYVLEDEWDCTKHHKAEIEVDILRNICLLLHT